MRDFISGNEPIRPSIVDGIFYPNNRELLTKEIKNYLDTTNTEPGNAFALITPHAAFEYSGKLLASAFKSAIYRDIKTVVILGPMHRDPVEGLAVPTASFFETPMGKIKVNKKYISRLNANCNNIIYDDIPHFEEHSIEVILPFIHYMFPSSDIVPLLVGNQSIKSIEDTSNALNLTFEEDFKYILFVVSSNMSSYLIGKKPREEAHRLIKLILQKGWKEIANSSATKKISGCGSNAIAMLLAMDEFNSNLKLEPRLLGEKDSISMDGDENKIVHYASMAFFSKILET